MVKSIVYVSQEWNMQQFPYPGESIPSPPQHSQGTSVPFNGLTPLPAALSSSNKRGNDSLNKNPNRKRQKLGSPSHDDISNESSANPLGPTQFDIDKDYPDLFNLFPDVGDTFIPAEVSTPPQLPFQLEISQPFQYSGYPFDAGYTDTPLMPSGHNLENSLIFQTTPDRQKNIEIHDVSTNLHDEIGQNALQYTPIAGHDFNANTHSREENHYLFNHSLNVIKTPRHLIKKDKERQQNQTRLKKIKSMQNSIIYQYYTGTLDAAKIQKNIDDLKKSLKESLEKFTSKNTASQEYIKATKENGEKIMAFYIFHWRNQKGYNKKFISCFASDDSPIKEESIKRYTSGLDTMLKNQPLDGIKPCKDLTKKLKEKQKNQTRFKKTKDMQNSIISQHFTGMLDTEKIPKDIVDLKKYLKESFKNCKNKINTSIEYIEAAKERKEKVIAFYIFHWRNEKRYKNEFLSYFASGDSPMQQESIRKYIDGVDKILKNR